MQFEWASSGLLFSTGAIGTWQKHKRVTVSRRAVMQIVTMALRKKSTLVIKICMTTGNDSFVISPESTKDHHIIFQEKGVSRLRMADGMPIVNVPLDSSVECSESSSPLAPSQASLASVPSEECNAPPVHASKQSPPLTLRACRPVATSAWMHEATCKFVDALVASRIPKQTAALWTELAATDLAPLIERQAQRQARAAQALQASIESSPPERSRELAVERDRCLHETQAAVDELNAIADRCADALDAASHAASDVRSTMRQGRRDVESMHRSLCRMCTPAMYRSWAPRIREILDEEAQTAYESLQRSADARLADVRCHHPADPPTSHVKVKVSTPTSAHLHTMIDAMQAGQKLRGLQRLMAAATRSVRSVPWLVV